ncbi:MAG: ATP-binding protein [Prevotella sp.]|nr:ATP-binding protein [Prevotella sp.]
MRIGRNSHWQFLEDELKAETEEFNKKFLSKAISLLSESEEMFVGQFLKFRDGEMIMKFPNTRSLPRKGEYLMCMVLPDELRNYHNWGDMTYRDLYKSRFSATEAVCIWHSPTDDKRFSLVGFNNISLDFAAYIEKAPGVILTFAPQWPPIDYIMNLQKIVNDNLSNGVSQVLDTDYQQKDWEPILIKQDNVADFVCTQLNLTGTMILQGPPGTGKTYMIAELCARLCKEGKSVMVTALTNRALMEIAEKPQMQSLLEEGKIYKTNITKDEYEELRKLQPLKEILPIPSALVLSTYYITSGFAAGQSIEQPFDYVIMDEASQALLTMFAASRKMGKKNLWVGDTNQLSPIVSLNGDRIKFCNYQTMVDGLQVLAENSSCPIYQLTNTYRFGKRSADYTGIFYNGTLVSKSTNKISVLPSIKKIVNKDGGPTLVLTDMDAGDRTPRFAILLAAYIVGSILSDDKNKDISVLTCLRKTTRELQKTINQTIPVKANIRIDTVARIQGLTTDITIFFVPNTSYIRTLEPHLFNVATSRAREHTIIIADKNVLEYPVLKPKVRTFMEKLKAEQFIYIPSSKQDDNMLLTKQLLIE